MASFATQGANRVPRVLYFIAGALPTDEHKDDIARFGPNASFRNSLLVSDVAVSPLEECDAVAGPNIPARYAAVYPNINDVDTQGRLMRMSDFDRRHGPIHSVDNEAARAAKPPSFGADLLGSQGAPRPAGAMTVAGGGFVAPTPGNPDNLATMGSERAENGPEGPNVEGRQGQRLNPQALPDRGVSLLPEGVKNDQSGPTANGGGVAGFTAPTPAAETADDADEGSSTKGKRGAKGSTGDTGSAA